MIIYLNPINYQCYCHQPMKNCLIVETDFFDGKCKEYIEGYRFIPEGHSWTRSDNKIFKGPVIMPWRSLKELENAQFAYERIKMEEYALALETMGVVL